MKCIRASDSNKKEARPGGEASSLQMIYSVLSVNSFLFNTPYKRKSGRIGQ